MKNQDQRVKQLVIAAYNREFSKIKEEILGLAYYIAIEDYGNAIGVINTNEQFFLENFYNIVQEVAQANLIKSLA